MPAESVIERLRRLEAEDSIWPVRVPRGDLRLLIAVAEAEEKYRVAFDEMRKSTNKSPYYGDAQDRSTAAREALFAAVRALRAGGSDV